MTLIIRSLNTPPQARLRQLIMESLGELLGESSRALPATDRLPADTFAAVDGAQRLWVISYTNNDAGRALLDGMAALQEVRALLPWLRQARLVTPSTSEVRVLLLTPTLPSGATELCRTAPLDWRCMRFLEVNGEPGIWFDPVALRPSPASPARPATTGAQPSTPAHRRPTDPAQPADSGKPQTASLKPLTPGDPPLSPEEEAFFQHL